MKKLHFKICARFLNFLKNLKTRKKFELLHNTINEFFREDIKDINFVNWLVKKINMKPAKLLEAFSNWSKIGVIFTKIEDEKG